MLAKGSDEKLKALAEQEIKSLTDADQQVQLADAWWDVGQKEAGIARDSLHLHAGNIYQSAMPNLASALKKAAIEKRLAEIADLHRPSSAAANLDTPGGNLPAFPISKWVDILRIVDPTRDTVKGRWSRDGKEISCEREDFSRLVIPVIVEGSYELEVDFTRTAGDSDVNAFFGVGSHQCLIKLSSDIGGHSGIEMIDGHGVAHSENPASIKPGVLENGRRYQLLVKVQLSQPDHASIEVALDGKRYLPHWEGNPESLSIHGDWSLPNGREFALGSFKSRVTFHSVRLRMVSGRASADFPVAESTSPQIAPIGVASEKPSGVGPSFR